MDRKPLIRSLDKAQRPFYVGIDLGGTNIKIGVVDSTGATFYRHSIPTEHDLGADDACARMGAAVREAIAALGLRPKRDVPRVGLGSPGAMDIPHGMLLCPINLPTWKYYPLRDSVSEQCGLPITFENDGNAAAYGEKWVGAGKGRNSLLLLTLGTGVGCGIIVGDMILDGEHSHGGESGHILVDPSDDAPLCGCGRRGCLEAYASATGLAKRVRSLIGTNRKSAIAKHMDNGAKLDGLLIAQLAEAGDPVATEAVMDTARWLGIGIVSLVHTIDPSIVLLGGAMTFGGEKHPLGQKFLEQIRAEVRARALPMLTKHIKIRFARLGGNAGYIGAAGIARLEHLGLRPPGLPTPKRVRAAAG